MTVSQQWKREQVQKAGFSFGRQRQQHNVLARAADNLRREGRRMGVEGEGGVGGLTDIPSSHTCLHTHTHAHSEREGKPWRQR